MATVLERGDDNNDNQVMTCTLCKGELKTPKLLPCQHSFCTQCLVQHHDDNDKGKPFCCPTCQMGVELEDGTVHSIPDNYLHDLVNEPDDQELYVTCTPCNEGNKEVNATHKCLDCGDTLCLHCSEYHCRLTATKHHVVVTLSDIREVKFKDKLFSKRKVLYCDIHSTIEHNVPMRGYCDTCRKLVCADCMHCDHRGHDFTKIHLVKERRQMVSNDQLSKLKRSHRDQDKRIGNIKKAITDTKQKWNQQEGDIYNTAAELYTIVDTIKQEKLTELKSLYEQELQFLNDLLNKERDKQSSLQATVTFTEMFLEKCSDFDFLFHKNDIQNRLESSQRGLSHRFKRNLVSIEKQETQSVRQAVENVLGRVARKKHDFHHKCKIGQVVEQFKRKIGIDEIGGLAFNTHATEILVSGSDWLHTSERISVWDEEGIRKRIIQCEHLNKSSDIDVNVNTSQISFTTICPNSRKVTIIDQCGIAQKSMMLPNDDQVTNFPLGLLIFDDNTIFIASSRMNRIYKWNLQEDKLTTVISQELGGHLYGPLYLCRTPRDQLIVSNTGSSNIQVYSKEGELQWQYDGKQDGNALRYPKGVCCDEDGYIYVIDKGNRRIQVINDRKLVGIIPIDKEIENETVVPLILASDGDLIYGYKNNLKKISFWE